MRILSSLLFVLLFASCSVSKKLERSARENVLNAGVLKTAHVGISVYEPATGKTWYDYQGDHYFVPASNTKIPTCYAAMKYLGDSLVGLRVAQKEDHFFISGTGDPTFLHEDYTQQPVLTYLTGLVSAKKYVWFGNRNPAPNAWGSGWSWTDYESYYMAERSPFPIYGNTVAFDGRFDSIGIYPTYFQRTIKTKLSSPNKYISDIKRSLHTNEFNTAAYGTQNRKIYVPFVTSDTLSYRLLSEKLGNPQNFIHPRTPPPVFFDDKPYRITFIHSQPTDSLLRPMMHRSDNFFAEQSLLMVSNELLGFMNDEKIIDTLLKTDFNNLPQKPRWVDGSGLSRYNLFTPQDFVFILNKMKNEFGMARIKNIFATGGEGTLSNYYVNDKDFIYAKTGTLSGVVALSGFLTTKKGAELIFSVQVNNHNGSATEVRRAVEKFVEGIRERF